MIIAIRLATKKAQCFNFCANLAGNHYLQAVRQEAVGAVYITRTFTITPTVTPNSDSVATAGAAATTVVTANRRRHGGDFNTGRANTAVTTNGTPSSTVIPSAPAAPVLPRLPRLFPQLLWSLPRLL